MSPSPPSANSASARVAMAPAPAPAPRASPPAQKPKHRLSVDVVAAKLGDALPGLYLMQRDAGARDARARVEIREHRSDAPKAKGKAKAKGAKVGGET